MSKAAPNLGTAPNLGSKYKCFKCECRFYDLGTEVPLCPRCGADQREDPDPDPRSAFLASLRRPPSRKRPDRRKKKTLDEVPAPKTIDEVDADDDLLDDLDEDDATPDDTVADAKAPEEPAKTD